MKQLQCWLAQQVQLCLLAAIKHQSCGQKAKLACGVPAGAGVARSAAARLLAVAAASVAIAA